MYSTSFISLLLFTSVINSVVAPDIKESAAESGQDGLLVDEELPQRGSKNAEEVDTREKEDKHTALPTDDRDLLGDIIQGDLSKLEGINDLFKKNIDAQHPAFDEVFQHFAENFEAHRKLDAEPEEESNEEEAPSPPEKPKTPREIEADRLYDEAMQLLNKTRRQDNLNHLVFKLLYEAAELDHVQAREKVSLAMLLGHGVKQAINASFGEFSRLANEGSARGQFGLGFMHFYGLAGLNASIARGLLYLNFAALAGDSLAEMAMGYRYWIGMGVEESCEDALTFYSRVAGKVAKELMDNALSRGSVLAPGPGVHRIRLVDEAEAGFMGGSTAAGTLFIDDDLLDYFQMMADKNNVSAQVGLGQLYYQGKHGVPQDHDKALHFFKAAADAGSSIAEAYLGEIYMAGTETMEPDVKIGMKLLERAVEQNNPLAQTAMGLIYLYGRGGISVQPVKALELFLKAADQGFADAQLHLGLMFLGTLGTKADYKLALKYFTLASQQGNILALHNLAVMHSTGRGVIRSCPTATELFKNVAERGKWSALWNHAHTEYWAGHYNEAFLQYLFLAHLGYEVAESNAAFMLDEGKVSLVSADEAHRRAIHLWQRSANQGSVVSRLKLGDYYYYGLGAPVDYTLAIQNYRTAAEMQRSSQAMFNLGYMHEQGLGYKRDIHLAKRWYDMAAETSADAYLPTLLALSRLQVYFALESFRETRILGFIHQWLFGKPESARMPAKKWSFRLQWSGKKDFDYYLVPILLGLIVILWFYNRMNFRP